MTQRNSKKPTRIIPVRITMFTRQGQRTAPEQAKPRTPDPAAIAIGSVADMCGMESADELRAFLDNEGLCSLMKNRAMLYRNGLFAVLAAVNAYKRAGKGTAQ